MYCLSKRLSLMDRYVRIKERIRRQEARIEVQQAKTLTLEAALVHQQHKLRVAEKQHTRLLKESWKIHAGFTPAEDMS